MKKVFACIKQDPGQFIRRALWFIGSFVIGYSFVYMLAAILSNRI